MDIDITLATFWITIEAETKFLFHDFGDDRSEVVLRDSYGDRTIKLRGARQKLVELARGIIEAEEQAQ